MIGSDWPFDQAENVGAISTRRVVFSGAAVLLVVHYSDDHSWAFLDSENFATEEGVVVGMGRAVQSDDTLREIADLPPGWVARRDCVGGEWSREPDPDV